MNAVLQPVAGTHRIRFASPLTSKPPLPATLLATCLGNIASSSRFCFAAIDSQSAAAQMLLPCPLRHPARGTVRFKSVPAAPAARSGIHLMNKGGFRKTKDKKGGF